MFKEKSPREVAKLYHYFKKLQRAVLAVAIIINCLLIFFMVSDLNLGIIVFVLNLYVSASFYWRINREEAREKARREVVRKE